MAKSKTIKVSNVEVRGPFVNKTTGDAYNRHIYVDHEGTEYFKFANTTASPEVKVGSTVKLLVDSTSNAKGTTNKIISLETVQEDTMSTRVCKAVNPPITGKKVINSTLTSKDLSIARMNALTTAVSLLSASGNTSCTLSDAVSLAEKIVSYTTEPYSSEYDD